MLSVLHLFFFAAVLRNEALLANPDVDRNLSMFIDAYRNHGHKKASFDPLGLAEPW